MSNPITLSQAIEGRILAANAKGLSINTIKEYSLYYRKLMTFMPDDPDFTSITVERLREFMAAQTHLSKKTRSNIRVSLSSMWSWAVDYKIITANVAADLDIIKPESRAIHPYTKEDVQAMLANVDKSKAYTRPGKRKWNRCPVPFDLVWYSKISRAKILMRFCYRIGSSNYASVV